MLFPSLTALHKLHARNVHCIRVCIASKRRWVAQFTHTWNGYIIGGREGGEKELRDERVHLYRFSFSLFRRDKPSSVF